MIYKKAPNPAGTPNPANPVSLFLIFRNISYILISILIYGKIIIYMLPKLKIRKAGLAGFFGLAGLGEMV